MFVVMGFGCNMSYEESGQICEGRTPCISAPGNRVWYIMMCRCACNVKQDI